MQAYQPGPGSLPLAPAFGIGPVNASAVAATVGDFKQFRNGPQLGAWIGLTPRQHSSGGKNNLGGISKRGDTYLRTPLIQGAKSAVMTAHRRTRRDIEDVLNRSNRRWASSTNAWWRSFGSAHVLGLEPHGAMRI